MTRTINKAPDRPWHQVPAHLFYTKGGTHVVVADTAPSLGGSSWRHLHKLDTCHPKTKLSICKTRDAQLASFQMGGFPADSTTAPAATESTLLQQCSKFSSQPQHCGCSSGHGLRKNQGSFQALLVYKLFTYLHKTCEDNAAASTYDT